MIYKWKAEEAMSMPASRFFAMLRAGRELRAIERAATMADLCDVSSISLGDSKFYTLIKDGFRTRARTIAGATHGAAPLPPKPTAVDSGSDTAKRAMFGLFTQAKRFT